MFTIPKFAIFLVFAFLGVQASGPAVLAQTLKARFGNPATRSLVVDALIQEEGSYSFQRSAGDFTNWVTVTNFNALPGTNTFSWSRTNKQHYFRLYRHTAAPAITTQPLGATNFHNDEVRLEAAVTGSWPLRFQWFKDGQPVANANTNRLVFSGRANLSGNYNLLVSNLWGMEFTTPVAVKTVNPVAATISGKQVRYVVKGAQGNFVGAGTFETTYNAQGYYHATSTSVLLTDTGYWQYGILAENQGGIYMPGSVTYPNAVMTLTFTTLTNGTYTLQVPNRAGGQWGDFNFVN